MKIEKTAKQYLEGYEPLEVVAGLLKELASLREQLKQERNKTIDECIVIVRNAVKTGFPHYHIASVLQTLKRKDNEPEFTHPDETED